MIYVIVKDWSCTILILKEHPYQIQLERVINLFSNVPVLLIKKAMNSDLKHVHHPQIINKIFVESQDQYLNFFSSENVTIFRYSFPCLLDCLAVGSCRTCMKVVIPRSVLKERKLDVVLNARSTLANGDLNSNIWRKKLSFCLWFWYYKTELAPAKVSTQQHGINCVIFFVVSKNNNNSNNTNQNNHFAPFDWVCAECKIVNHFVTKASISVLSFLFFFMPKNCFRKNKTFFNLCTGLSEFHAESTNLSVRVD